MAHSLHRRTSALVCAVHVTRLDWLATSWLFGWIGLDLVKTRVRELTSVAKGRTITLIGHGSGGVMLRPFPLQSFLSRTTLWRCAALQPDLEGRHASVFCRRSERSSYRSISDAPTSGEMPAPACWTPTSHGGFFGTSCHGSLDRVEARRNQLCT